MKRVMQRFLHEPQKGIVGDCWAACIASITEIPLEEIPSPNEQDNKVWPRYWINMCEFLKDRGFKYYVEEISNFSYDGYCIAVGKSPRCVGENSNLYHAVVWKNGIIHDPHPDQSGIQSIIQFEIIEKL